MSWEYDASGVIKDCNLESLGKSVMNEIEWLNGWFSIAMLDFQRLLPKLNGGSRMWEIFVDRWQMESSKWSLKLVDPRVNLSTAKRAVRGGIGSAFKHCCIELCVSVCLAKPVSLTLGKQRHTHRIWANSIWIKGFFEYIFLKQNLSLLFSKRLAPNASLCFPMFHPFTGWKPWGTGRGDDLKKSTSTVKAQRRSTCVEMCWMCDFCWVFYGDSDRFFRCHKKKLDRKLLQLPTFGTNVSVRTDVGDIKISLHVCRGNPWVR